MRRPWRTGAAIAALIVTASLQPAQSRSAHAQTQGPGLPHSVMQQHQQRQQRLADLKKQYTDRTGKFRPDLWLKGISQIKRMRVLTAIPAGRHQRPKSTVRARRAEHSTRSVPGGVIGVQWQQIGPGPNQIDGAQGVMGSGPDSGQVTDIAIDPRGTADQTIYIATDDGGIWKTTDGGNTWAAKTDYMPTNSMGSVALDPSNPSIVYAGTGDAYNNGFFAGVGIYKSTDGGNTWSVIGANVFGATPSNQGLSVNRIVVLPGNVVLAATSGGLYRSVDGGLNWGNNAPSYNNGLRILGGYIWDLKDDTVTQQTVWAGVAGGGLYKSIDGGVTFGANSPSFNDGNPLFTPTVAAGDSLSAVSFAEAANGTTMYVTGEQDKPNPNPACTPLLYESTDGGSSWTGQTASGIGGCQGSYDFSLGVDPQNPNNVYIGEVDLWHSTDSGATFSNDGDSSIHDDNHAFTASPQSHWSGAASTKFWVGTDGGVSTSNDDGATWSNPNGAIASNVMFSIDIGRNSTANNGYSYGAIQDQGVPVRRPGFSGTDWHLNTGGDGTTVAVDAQNGQHAFAAFNNQLVETTNAGVSWTYPGASGLYHNAAPINCCGIITLIAVDPNNARNVYAVSTSSGTTSVSNAAADSLWVSTDGAATFTLAKTFTAGTGVSYVATDVLDSQTVWVGLGDGSVWSSSNAQSTSSTWTQHSVTGAPAGQGVTSIALDPTNTSVAVVTYGGFCNCSNVNRTHHVFMTTDGGTSWSDISGTDGGNASQNLPDIPIHSVVIDPGVSPHAIIVSSDSAVLRSADNGSSWQVLGAGFPSVDALSLQLDSTASPSLLRVGTFGRSAWELTSSGGPILSVNANLAFGTVAVGDNKTSIVQLFNTGSQDLHISSITRSSGSSDFSLISGPATPVTIPAGHELDYTIKYAPTVAGPEQATFQINSDAPGSPTLLQASGTGGAPAITLGGDLQFGTVARGTTATKTVTVTDTGDAPLKVTSVAFDTGSSGAFSVTGPSTPQTIKVGENVSFTVQFAPSIMANGTPLSGTLRVQGVDALYPSLAAADQILTASGTPGVPVAGLTVGPVTFGSVPVDERTTPHTADQTIHIYNQASCALCDLHVSGITIGGANPGDFSIVSPNPLTFPMTVGAGNHVDITVRFDPSDAGARTASIQVATDDPVNPTLSDQLSGNGLVPGISPSTQTIYFPPTVYDPQCSPTCGTTQNATVTNSGQAELSIDQLSFGGSTAFSGPAVTSPATRTQPTSVFSEPVTFHPTGAAARAVRGTLHIQDLFPSPLDHVSTPVQADVNFCGESVGRGIRVLVKDTSGNVVSSLSKLSLQSHGLTNPVNIQLKTTPLNTVSPPTSCQTFQYHYENQNLQPAGTASNRGSYYNISVSVGSKQANVSFTLGINEFKQMTLVVQ